jgi:hypothetical protein
MVGAGNERVIGDAAIAISLNRNLITVRGQKSYLMHTIDRCKVRTIPYRCKPNER